MPAKVSDKPITRPPPSRIWRSDSSLLPSPSEATEAPHPSCPPSPMVPSSLPAPSPRSDADATDSVSPVMVAELPSTVVASDAVMPLSPPTASPPMMRPSDRSSSDAADWPLSVSEMESELKCSALQLLGIHAQWWICGGFKELVHLIPVDLISCLVSRRRFSLTLSIPFFATFSCSLNHGSHHSGFLDINAFDKATSQRAEICDLRTLSNTSVDGRKRNPCMTRAI